MHFSIDHRENRATMADGHMYFVFVTGQLDGDDRPRPTPVPEGCGTS